MRNSRVFLLGLLGSLILVPLLCAFSPNQITLDFGDRQIMLNESLVQGGWYNYDAKLAFTYGRDWFTRAGKMTENDTFIGTFPDIVQYIEKIAPQFEVAPDDGRVNFFPHQTPQFTVTHQQAGRRLDRERLYGDLLAVLKGNKYPYVTVHYQAVLPTPPAQIIQQITRRSTFSTTFRDNPTRENNLRLALSKFNGLVVNPGEEVSFNQVVGPRTAAQGYQEAKIIVQGEYVDGIGGGVCQVSTTIFNAVAQAGLQILESHNHSLPSSYVPLGKDAMVSAHADLRFVNNTGAPLYFATKVSNHQLQVTIYGRDKGTNISYRLATETVKEIKPTDTLVKDLPDALQKAAQAHPEQYEKTLVKAGTPGYTVVTYLETYQGSRRLSKKLLRRATYQATPNQYTYTLKPTAPSPDNVTPLFVPGILPNH